MKRERGRKKMRMNRMITFTPSSESVDLTSAISFSMMVVTG